MKKIFFALIFLSGIFFSGCKKKAAKSPAAATAAKNGIVFQIWTTENEKFFTALAAEFSAAVKIPGFSTKILTFKNEKFLHEFLVEKMAEGRGPDVIFTTGNFVAQNIKKLAPVENSEILTPENFKKTFVRAANETLIHDGKIFGVPMGIDSLAIFYNEEHLIDHLSDRNSPGRTWEIFQNDAEKLSHQNNSFERFLVAGAAIGRAENLNYAPEILENLMLQSGVKFFSDDGRAAIFADANGISSDGKKINFAVDALNFFTSFADARRKNFSWSEFLVPPDAEKKDFSTFVAGKVSMVFGRAADFLKIKKMIVEKNSKLNLKNLRVAFLPQKNDPQNSTSREIVGRVRALAVPRTAKFPTVSWKFLQFAIKKENLRSFFAETKIPTPRLDLISEQESEPHIGIFVRQAKFARPNILPIDRAEFRAEFSALISKINDGKISAKKGLENLQQNWNEFLTEKFRRENF